MLNLAGSQGLVVPGTVWVEIVIPSPQDWAILINITEMHGFLNYLEKPNVMNIRKFPIRVCTKLVLVPQDTEVAIIFLPNF